MRVLEGFCGRGGWSRPFVEDGDQVVGFDIMAKFRDKYPGAFFQADIRELDGRHYQGYDFMIGSTPCTEFSGPKHAWGPAQGHPPHPEQGIELIKEWYRFVDQAKPRYWVMENISNSRKWFKEKPIWTFYISMRGRRHLWGTLPIPLSPELKFNRVFGCTRETRLKHGRKSVRDSSRRAEIPYPVARFIADTVHAMDLHTTTTTGE